MARFGLTVDNLFRLIIFLSCYVIGVHWQKATERSVAKAVLLMGNKLGHNGVQKVRIAQSILHPNAS